MDRHGVLRARGMLWLGGQQEHKPLLWDKIGSRQSK